MRARKLRDAIVIAQHAVVIHDDDGFRARRNEIFCFVEVDAERVFFDVSKDGLGAGRDDRLKIGGVIERRRDHFVARPDAHREQSEMNRGVAGAGGRDVTIVRAEISLELLLKLANVTAHAEPAKLEGAAASVDFFLFDEGFEDRYLHSFSKSG
jgi:hypothetical protein